MICTLSQFLHTAAGILGLDIKVLNHGGDLYVEEFSYWRGFCQAG